MYIDAQLLFDDAAAHLTTGASTNLVDFGIARDLGTGEDLYLVAIVDTAFTDTGSDSTMALTIETDSTAAFSSATTAQTVGTFAALSAAGSRLVVKLQPDLIDEQFVRVKYTVADGDLTTGAFTVFLTNSIDSYTAYADGFTIS